tara:strand:+ start:2276 stop:2464 length:189 start_codon:yes stop_codon:yes gene_type:complete
MLLRRYNKVIHQVLIVGIVLNTAMLMYNVVEDNDLGLVILNFVSAIALFFALGMSKKRNRND